MWHELKKSLLKILILLLLSKVIIIMFGNTISCKYFFNSFYSILTYKERERVPVQLLT